MNHEHILEILNFRYSCKEFDSQKKIPQIDLELILKAGQLSPSSMGLEPWKFLVIENQDLINKLIPMTPGGIKQLSTCSHLVIVLSRQGEDLKHNSEYLNYIISDIKQLPEEAAKGFKKMIANIERNRFFDSPQAMLNYSTSQAYLAVANMTLVSAMLGIDSCIVGAFNKEDVSDFLIKQELLDSKHFSLTLFIPFGYRANEIMEKKRQPFNDVVTWVK